MFAIGGERYGPIDEDGDEALQDEETCTVGEVAKRVGEFEYDYDFGDGWQHDVRIDNVMRSIGRVVPHVVDGARACPREDCGGTGGYLELIEHPHEGFDPDAFEPSKMNETLELLSRHTRAPRYFSTASKASEGAIAPNTPPCIVTMCSAAW